MRAHWPCLGLVAVVLSLANPAHAAYTSSRSKLHGTLRLANTLITRFESGKTAKEVLGLRGGKTARARYQKLARRFHTDAIERLEGELTATLGKALSKQSRERIEYGFRIATFARDAVTEKKGSTQATAFAEQQTIAMANAQAKQTGRASSSQDRHGSQRSGFDGAGTRPFDFSHVPPYGQRPAGDRLRDALFSSLFNRGPVRGPGVVGNGATQDVANDGVDEDIIRAILWARILRNR